MGIRFQLPRTGADAVGEARRNSDIIIVMTNKTLSPAIMAAKRSSPGVGDIGGPWPWIMLSRNANPACVPT